ncbi:MAG: hypothetical protein V4649_18555 [Bacteroidota bacterium]
MSHSIKALDVHVAGNNATFNIKGAFINPKFTLNNVEVRYQPTGIDLFIHSDYDENGPIISVTSPFHETITVNNLKHGKYFVRIDNNNKWVKWFNV